MKPATEYDAMHKPDIIDEIIRDLDPEQIPAEFIILAKVSLADGREAIVPGDELEEVMEKYGDDVMDVRVILDVRKIRLVITEKADRILAEAEAEEQ